MTDGGAACAVHPERASVSTCERCGRFSCAACAQSSPCLECQLRQREASPALSPLFDRLIGVAAVLYAVCTAAILPALAQLAAQDGSPDATRTAAIATLAIEGVYVAVWLALIALWLAWFFLLHDWAKGRGIDVPSRLGAIGGLLVCGVNVVHPLLTLRAIRRASGVRTPLGLWWALSWGGVTLATVRSAGPAQSMEPLSLLAAAMEVAGVLLCWKIAHDFRLADQAWNPGAQLAARA